MPQTLLVAPVALVPVLLFLATLLFFDSYKLVTLREIFLTLSLGAVLAVAAYFANGALAGATHMPLEVYSRTIAPVVEETLKASAVLYLFARNRIGFLIDAAILGFAVGAGFAIVENLYLLFIFPDASVGLWVVRGFGTAIMHSGATALFALLVQALIERRFRPIIPVAVLAYLGPVLVHALFNRMDALPLVSTILLLALLPPSFMLVFTKSEHGVHDWLWHDYESHHHLLEQLQSGEFQASPEGRLIAALARKFSEAFVALIFEYIQIHTGLVMQAEELELARERGEKPVLDHSVKDKFKRLHELEKQIGFTAMLTIWPHLHFTRRELWELHELEDAI